MNYGKVPLKDCPPKVALREAVTSDFVNLSKVDFSVAVVTNLSSALPDRLKPVFQTLPGWFGKINPKAAPPPRSVNSTITPISRRGENFDFLTLLKDRGVIT